MLDFSQLLRFYSKEWPETTTAVCCLCATLLSGCNADSEDTSPLTTNLSAETVKLDDFFRKDRLLKVDIELSDKDWNMLRHQSRSTHSSLQSKRQFEMLETPYTYV